MSIIVELTRESVCYADSIEAPHSLVIPFPDRATFRDLAEWIDKSNYLPNVSGGSTWILSTSKAAAVLSDKWGRPRFVGMYNAELKDLIGDEPILSLKVGYRPGMDPLEVLRAINR